jgi:hypothetical protein
MTRQPNIIRRWNWWAKTIVPATAFGRAESHLVHRARVRDRAAGHHLQPLGERFRAAAGKPLRDRLVTRVGVPEVAVFIDTVIWIEVVSERRHEVVGLDERLAG